MTDFQIKKNFEERIKVCYYKNKEYTNYYIELKEEEMQQKYTFRDLKDAACAKW